MVPRFTWHSADRGSMSSAFTSCRAAYACMCAPLPACFVPHIEPNTGGRSQGSGAGPRLRPRRVVCVCVAVDDVVLCTFIISRGHITIVFRSSDHVLAAGLPCSQPRIWPTYLRHGVCSMTSSPGTQAAHMSTQHTRSACCTTGWPTRPKGTSRPCLHPSRTTQRYVRLYVCADCLSPSGPGAQRIAAHASQT